MFDKRRVVFIALGVLFLLSLPVSGQQSYVTRFDAYGGYAFLDSPVVNLFENGFSGQIGVRPRTWFSLGVDYTIVSGDLALTTSQLLPALQQQLQTAIVTGVTHGVLPATYPYGTLSVPVHSRTQTFAAGPQLAYRHFSKVTLFWRPVFAGIIHEVATPKPTDAVMAALVGGLITGPNKKDNTMFIGFGGGFDILFGKHFGWRTQADLVHDHLFNDLLTDARFTVRFSSGPCFNFGPNIKK